MVVVWSHRTGRGQRAGEQWVGMPLVKRASLFSRRPYHHTTHRCWLGNLSFVFEEVELVQSARQCSGRTVNGMLFDGEGVFKVQKFRQYRGNRGSEGRGEPSA